MKELGATGRHRVANGDGLVLTGFPHAGFAGGSVMLDASHQVNQIALGCFNSGALSFGGSSGGPCLVMQSGCLRLVGVLSGSWHLDSRESSIRRIE